jgi:hypothetical protein
MEILTKDKIEVINSIISDSPNLTAHLWLKVHPCNPADFFSNPDYLNKIVAAGITVSGAVINGIIPIYSLDVVRKDGNTFDTDRYLLVHSGSILFRNEQILKGFQGHHSSEIPKEYNKNEK